MDGVRINITGNPLLFSLIAGVFIAFSIMLYRRTNPPVSAALRRTLTLLRTSALIMIAFLLFEPLLTLRLKRDDKPVVAVLVDNSASMSLTDAGTVRPDELSRVLNHSVFNNPPKDIQFVYFAFSSGLRDLELQPDDSLTFTQDGTDIATSLQQLKTKLERANLAGVILASDGNYNIGENPARLAQDFGTPLFPIAIGDPTEQKDLLISSVHTNRITYVENKVPVDITIRAHGYRGKKISIRLQEGSDVIDSKEIVLNNNDLETRTRLHFTPLEHGNKKYSVIIPALRNELTSKNNKANFYVKVLKSKMQLLLIAGGPGLDHSFLSRTLKEDENIELTTRVMKNNTVFYEGDMAFSPEALGKYDGFVLLDFPRRQSSPATVDALARVLSESDKALFLIGGKNIFYPGLRPLQKFLPMAINSSTGNEKLVYTMLSGEGGIHPVMRLSENDIENQTVWKSLPPIHYSLRNVKLLDGAKSLLDVDKQASNILSETAALPAIITRNIGSQKTIVILGYDIWRWNFLMQGIGQYSDAYSQILTNCLRWLTTREDSKRVRIYPEKEVYRSGEKITINAEVYFEDYRPLDGAEVKVNIQSDGESNEILLSGIGNGKYEGTFQVLKAGEYTYAGTASSRDRLIAKDSGRFSIEEFSLEYHDTNMNETILKQIAENSGGTYHTVESMDALAIELDFPTRVTYEEIQWEIWNRIYLLITIILLLSIEWYIRKKRGML
ncbi:MAG: hypothetical protein V2J62_10650 [candidate division KSB1 bacterium]|nr:hypothetical protein [candidate division KSB1 bacterium]